MDVEEESKCELSIYGFAHNVFLFLFSVFDTKMKADV